MSAFEPSEHSEPGRVVIGLSYSKVVLGGDMRRREFITILGGAAATWPLAAYAQQPDGVRRIGVLMPLAESDPSNKRQLAAFVRQFEKLGWAEGRNLRTVKAAGYFDYVGPVRIYGAII